MGHLCYCCTYPVINRRKQICKGLYLRCCYLIERIELPEPFNTYAIGTICIGIAGRIENVMVPFLGLLKLLVIAQSLGNQHRGMEEYLPVVDAVGIPGFELYIILWIGLQYKGRRFIIPFEIHGIDLALIFYTQQTGNAVLIQRFNKSIYLRMIEGMETIPTSQEQTC